MLSNRNETSNEGIPGKLPNNENEKNIGAYIYDWSMIDVMFFYFFHKKSWILESEDENTLTYWINSLKDFVEDFVNLNFTKKPETFWREYNGSKYATAFSLQIQSIPSNFRIVL